MPTYEYVCDACGNEFEKEQRISEAPIKQCPSCGEDRARRQISQGNFILKGGGWYSDLYAGSGNKKAKPADGGGDSAAKSDSKPSTESKSESSGGSGSGKSSSGSGSSEGSSKPEAAKAA